MAFGLRKLMEDSPAPSINSTASTPTINGTLSQVCEPFCDPLINDSGYCISPCLYLCPTNCHYPIPPDFPYYSPPPPPPPGTSNRRMSPLIITTFVALSLAVLIVLGYLIYVRFYRRRGSRGGRNIAQSQRAVPPRDDELLGDIGPVLDHPIWYIHTIGLQPSVISKITMCKYKMGEGLIEGTDCSICLTEFEEDETLRLLPKCSHAFHVACIDTWLRSHTNCPNCRAPIVTSAAQSPSPEPSNETSWDEIRLDGGGDDDVDLGREIESAPPNRGETEEEAGQEMEELSASRPQDEWQPIRRSVSLDSLSAAKINLAVADFLMGKSSRKSGCESGDEDDGDQSSKRLGDSSLSVVRSVQFLSGPSSSMRRSLSWSGRFLGSKYGRNRSSLLPL